MKTIIFLLISFLCISSSVLAQNTGYAFVNSGASDSRVFKTTDGGQNWGNPGPTPVIISRVTTADFVDANTGYTFGNHGTSDSRVFKTTDGGQNWGNPGPAPVIISRVTAASFPSPNITSVQQIKRQDKVDLQIVQNPVTNGELNITVKNPIGKSITVFSITGQEVLSRKLNKNNTTINMSGFLKQGTCIVSLRDERNGEILSSEIVIFK